MIIDVQNEMRSYIKGILPNVRVETGYPEDTPTFPIVIVTESENTADAETFDTSGEKFNVVDLSIEIFTKGPSKKTEAMGIRKDIDTLLSGTYRMLRTFSSEVPNYADRNIYRYSLRYSFKINENKVIYRR